MKLQIATADMRPALIFDHVTDAAVNGLSIDGNKEAESSFRFIASQDVLMTATRIVTPTSVFLQVEGASSKNIKIDGGDLSKADKHVTFVSGAPKTAVKLRE